MDRDRLRHRQTDKAPYSGGSRDSRFSVGPSLECQSSRFVGKAAKVRAQRQGAFPKSALIRGRQSPALLEAYNRSNTYSQQGRYAADTFEMEDWARADRPATIAPRLIESEKTVLTPHLGSAVDHIRRDIAMDAARSVVQCLQGLRPDGAVNEPNRVDREDT